MKTGKNVHRRSRRSSKIYSIKRHRRIHEQSKRGANLRLITIVMFFYEFHKRYASTSKDEFNAVSVCYKVHYGSVGGN